MIMDCGLYFHIPFCIKKCIYCDFLSFPRSSGYTCREEEYFTALSNEWRERSALVTDGVDTVYIGGGTPSSVSPRRIYDILNDVRGRAALRENAEITVEVNPGTVSEEHFRIYKEAGVNRISIGIQSTQERLLRSLGRIHTYKDCEAAVRMARNAGISNISCDLIFGIPSVCEEPAQTYEELKEDIERLILLGVRHISAYSIIVEEGTPLYELYKCGRAFDADPDTERRMYYYIRKRLVKEGIQRYEISNYAYPGHESRHNMKYWECRPYLGIGLGAASYYPGSNDDYIRETNTRDPDEYMSGRYRGETEVISAEEQKREFMMLGFRKMSGPSPEMYKERFGTDCSDDFKDEIRRLKDKGLVYKKDGSMRLTLKGCDFANEVFREFVL